jgi:hypothetical protein
MNLLQAHILWRLVGLCRWPTIFGRFLVVYYRIAQISRQFGCGTNGCVFASFRSVSETHSLKHTHTLSQSLEHLSTHLVGHSSAATRRIDAAEKMPALTTMYMSALRKLSISSSGTGKLTVPQKHSNSR